MAKCKGKTLLVIEIFFTLHRYCTVTAQYWCSVSKAKHDQVFSVPRRIGAKTQISFNKLYFKVIITGDLSLPREYFHKGLTYGFSLSPIRSHMSEGGRGDGDEVVLVECGWSWQS